MIDKTLAVGFRMIRNIIDRRTIDRPCIEIGKSFDRCPGRPFPCTIGRGEMCPIVVCIIEYFLHDRRMSGRIMRRIYILIPPADTGSQLWSISGQESLSRSLKIPLISVSGRPFIIQGVFMIQFIKPSEGQV